MPYRELLNKTLRECGINRVAIVDDAFDAPAFDRLEATDFAALRGALTDLIDARDEEGDEGARAQIAELEAAVGKRLEDFIQSLREEEVYKPLWEVFARAEPGGPIYSLLAPLFGVLEADRRNKLHPLLILRRVLEEQTSAKVDVFDSTTSAEKVAGFDMVLLDFYLSEEVASKPTGKLTAAMKKRARTRSVRFLAELVNLDPDATPLVMLISSMATAEEMSAFRADAQMLASRMAFMPKAYAESDLARAQHSILSLAKHKPHADALVRVIRMWKDAVDEASKQLMVSVRELELTDYSYLQHYRLASEKTPLAQYMVWLFSGQLADTVERELKRKDVGRLVDAMHLPGPIPGLVAPSPGIARIYSSITTSRIPVAAGGFQPPAWAGDIFLETARYNEIYKTKRHVRRRQKAMPEVMAVVTPACDLVPGRTAEAKLRTVTMIGGHLVPLGQAVHPNVHLIMLADKPYVIVWDPKWPVTMSVDAMGPGSSSMAGRYQWVGRLRDLYHADLQHRLMADLGRVGLPVAPTMPENVGVRVLAKTGSGAGKYEVALEYPEEEGAAWTFAGERGKRSFCLRADLAWDVRRWVKEKDGDGRSVAKLREQVEERAFLDVMQSPVHFSEKEAARNPAGNVRYKRVADPMAEVGEHEQVSFVVAVARA